MLSLHRMILETVAYYDAFDYPLTEFEVWKLLLASDGEGEREILISFCDIREALRGSFLGKRLGRSRGYVFLRGRENLVSLRVYRQKNADRNIFKAGRIACLLRCMPFVRMIGLTGSLSMKNADCGSDWDFFIVLRSGYIWTGRAVATALLHIFGLRRHGRKVAHRACLNYWITTRSLEIHSKDLFSSSEYFFIIPLFGEKVFERFQKTNMWIRRFRPQFQGMKLPHLALVRDTFFSRFLRNSGEIFFAGLHFENILRFLQKKKIASNPKTKRLAGIIEATDDELIFLPHPRGPRVFETFRRRLSDVEANVI